MWRGTSLGCTSTTGFWRRRSERMCQCWNACSSLVCDGQFINSRSFNIGTLRLLSDAVSQSQWEEMKSAVADFCNGFEGIRIVGSGGNINKLYRLTPKRERKTEKLMVSSLKKLHTALSALTVEQRMEQYELREDRADVIVPAAELFLMVAEVAKAEDIVVPTVGLADGVINELAEILTLSSALPCSAPR